MSDASASPTPAPRKGVSILKKFFGLQPGQTLAQFASETRGLTDTDFEQLREGISNGTFSY